MTPSRADKFELSAEKGGLLIALFCHWETQVMKSWGILATIAMGFLMGLVLAGIGGISAGLQASSVQNKLQFKKIEDYWMATDIHKKDLQSVVNNANCYSSEKYFLSCVSSVVTAMQKTKLRLSYSGQVLLADSSHQDLDNFNERENLIPFTKIYKENLYLTFNFESIWKQIIEQSPESSAQYLYALGINGFLSVYRDPHTYILPTAYFNEVSAANERSPYFVGISFDRNEGKTFIRKVFKDSDADRSGIKSNDQVISINGEAVTGLTLSEVSHILKDKNIKTFTFTLKRDGQSYTKVIQRSYRILSQVHSEVVAGIRNVGILQITKFSKGICEDAKKHIQEMSVKNISGGLILDLRDNPGGHLSEAACLAGLFIGENKKIYSIKYFDTIKNNETALTSAQRMYSGPLVVLTNNSSASASEVIAGALQEYHRAVIVGKRTFGKGTFQEIEPWLDKTEISLFKTKGFYLLPSGSSTQFSGVQPDIELADKNDETREDLNYMNPINPQIFNLKFSQKNQSKLPLNSCVRNGFVPKNDDFFVSEALQVLSCSPVMSALAQMFNPYELN